MILQVAQPTAEGVSAVAEAQGGRPRGFSAALRETVRALSGKGGSPPLPAENVVITALSPPAAPHDLAPAAKASDSVPLPIHDAAGEAGAPSTVANDSSAPPGMDSQQKDGLPTHGGELDAVGSTEASCNLPTADVMDAAEASPAGQAIAKEGNAAAENAAEVEINLPAIPGAFLVEGELPEQLEDGAGMPQCHVGTEEDAAAIGNERTQPTAEVPALVSAEVHASAAGNAPTEEEHPAVNGGVGDEQRNRGAIAQPDGIKATEAETGLSGHAQSNGNDVSIGGVHPGSKVPTPAAGPGSLVSEVQAQESNEAAAQENLRVNNVGDARIGVPSQSAGAVEEPAGSEAGVQGPAAIAATEPEAGRTEAVAAAAGEPEAGEPEGDEAGKRGAIAGPMAAQVKAASSMRTSSPSSGLGSDHVRSLDDIISNLQAQVRPFSQTKRSNK